jgi:ABC-type branched-subunit amino acid transport system substrate-binding protein
MYPSEVLVGPEDTPRRTGTVVNVGLVIPMHGSAGRFALSCVACAVLAAEDINAEGGLLGREVRLVLIDGACSPRIVGERVNALVRAGEVDVVAGWHLSHVRRAIAGCLEGDVPYVYSTLYEGGERAPGVFLAGETPEGQVVPAMARLADELGIRRWAVVGDDYLWPRGSARAVHARAREMGIEITCQAFVPLGTEDFTPVLARLRRRGPQGVLMLLVGQDAVYFNRAFAAEGLHERMVRLSPLMDENMLLASGTEATRELYSAAAYFDSLVTADALDFVGNYAARFGPEAPLLNSMGESCYEGLRLLAALVRRTASLDVRALQGTDGSPVGYQGPRGSVYLKDRHLVQTIYLARADGTVFDVLAQL